MLTLLLTLVVAAPQDAPGAPPSLFAGQIEQADFEAVRRCHGWTRGRILAAEALMPHTSTREVLQDFLRRGEDGDRLFRRLWAGALHPDFGLDSAAGDQAYLRGIQPWETEIARGDIPALFAYFNRNGSVPSDCPDAAERIDHSVEFRDGLTGNPRPLSSY